MKLTQVMMVLWSLVVCTWARSFGLRGSGDSYGCNLMTATYGCKKFDFDRAIRIGCWDRPAAGQPPIIMWWASPPAVTTDFTLRTGEGAPGTDPTHYNPGEKMAIVITSVKSGHYYQGLLMYAVDKNEVKVGDWEVPIDSNPEFHPHPGTVCTKSVMHASAAYKRRVTRFSFITPPAGTGPITFRVMWKDGQPNPTSHGGFWIPPRNLTLQERGSPSSRKWVLAENGQTCAQVCSAQANGGNCIPDLQAGTFSATDEREILRIFPCQKAYFSECNTAGARVINKNENLCSFLDIDNCGKNNSRPLASPSCVTRSTSDSPLLCKCFVTVPTLSDESQNSASSSNKHVSCALLLFLFACAVPFQTKSGGSMVLLLCCLVFFTSTQVQAHNWIEGSRGRARDLQASTVQPAIPPVHPSKIDMQIYMGQEVQIEWATAHGGTNYFVVMSQSDEDQLSLNTEENLEDYILNAPMGSFHDGPANLTSSAFQKFGRNNAANTALGTTYAAAIPSSHALYLGDRPSVWYSSGLSNQMAYLEQSIRNDRRVAYESTKYPWIEAVHKYSNIASDIDSVRLTIPARKGPGRYIIHYIWSSYRDIYDVDVHAAPTPGAKVLHPYGVPANGTITYMRFDHCIFEGVAYSDKCWEAPGDGEFARKKCDRDGPSCRAYGLVPVKTLAPWTDYTPLPYRTTDSPRNSSGCNLTDLQARLLPDGMASFTVMYYRGFDNGAAPPWTIFTDAENIAWYSTCYVKLSPLQFDLPITSLPAVPSISTLPYRFGNKCIPCEDHGMNLTNGPRWRVADACEDCDKAPAAVKRNTQLIPDIESKSPATAFAASYVCQSSPTAPPCANITWITLAGSAWMYELDCYTKVATEPGCSKYGAWFDGNYDFRYPGDWYFSMYQAGKNCMCWKASAQLPPATRADTSGWSTFKLV